MKYKIYELLIISVVAVSSIGWVWYNHNWAKERELSEVRNNLHKKWTHECFTNKITKNGWIQKFEYDKPVCKNGFK